MQKKAADRFRLELNDLRIEGGTGEQTINLRKLLREQHGDFVADRFELRNVRVVAKSRKNNGSARPLHAMSWSLRIQLHRAVGGC